MCPLDGIFTDVLISQDSSSEHINLKVQGQEGSIVHFKIKKSTPLRKLMNAYCERMVSGTFVLVYVFLGLPTHVCSLHI